MRTTLTLEDDVARALDRVRKRRGETLKQIVNQALRRGLAALETPPRRRRKHATRTVSLGRCRVNSIDDVAETLAGAEGEGFR